MIHYLHHNRQTAKLQWDSEGLPMKCQKQNEFFQGKHQPDAALAWCDRYNGKWPFSRVPFVSTLKRWFNIFLQQRVHCQIIIESRKIEFKRLQNWQDSNWLIDYSSPGEESLTIFLDKQKLNKKSEGNSNSSVVSLELLHQLAASYFTDRESTLRRLHHLQIATSAIKVLYMCMQEVTKPPYSTL